MSTIPDLLLLFSGLLFFAFAANCSAEPVSPIAGLALSAESFEVSQDGKTFIARGNASALKGTTEIQAQNIVLWTETQEMYAEGNVIWIENRVLSRAEKLIYNWKDKRGIIVKGELRDIRPKQASNWYLKVPEAQQQGEGVTEINRSKVTTCAFVNSHQHFSARKVTFRNDHSIVLHHAFFHIHKVPVFYLPYYYRDLKYNWPWYHFGFGNSTEFGQFVRNDLGVEVYPGVDFIFELDYYSKRGTAFGFDVEYESPRRIGYLETYFISDEGEDVKGRALEENDRKRISLVHRELLSDSPWEFSEQPLSGWNSGRWVADVEVQEYSDKDFFREYFEREFKSNKEPENRIFVQGNWENTAFSALGQARVSEFFNQPQSQQRSTGGTFGQTEYLPRFRYDMLSAPLWENRLLFTAGTELARVRRRFEDGISLSTADALAEDRDINRLDLSAELSSPFKMNFLHLEPFIFGRETFFEEKLENTDDAWRSLYGAGLRLTSEFWRTFDYVNPKLRIDRFHHVIAPEITFLSVQEPSIDPDRLIFFDQVDSLDAVDRVNFQLRNLVQTKSRGTTYNWLEFDVETDFFPNARRDNLNKNWGNILTDLRWRPHPRVSLFNDTEINTEPLQFDIINTGVAIYPITGLSFRINHRFTRDVSNRTIGTMRFRVGKKYYVYYRQDFEWDDREAFDQRLIIQRKFHDWTVELGYEVDNSENDTLFSVFITPRGLSARSIFGSATESFFGGN